MLKSSWTAGLGGLFVAGTLLFWTGCGGGSSKKVYFGNLEDGSNLESPFKVNMKAENLIVEPATLGVNQGHGHFHILVDAQLAGPSGPMPKDEKHIHYGDGQVEAILDLPVGPHTLILQFAKGDHVPYDPPVYQQIQITVTKRNVANTAQAKVPDTTATVVKDSVKSAPADGHKAESRDKAAP